jgi:hypothetical protein
MHVLWLLRQLGLDPDAAEARRAVALVRDRVTWRGAGPPACDDHRFFAGELEPCINGQVVTAGAYFGQDVGALVDRLLGEQLPDGGWNCEAPEGSTRSSFNTTICVLEGAARVRAGVRGAARRHRGAPARRGLPARAPPLPAPLDRRGDRARPQGGRRWTRFAFPTWWHYDVLRGLDYLRDAGVAPDERVAEAVALVASKRGADGRWRVETRYPGAMPVEVEAVEGEPSRWVTLRALRVLDWAAA